MRLAVIGASGQVGSEIVAQARVAGFDVLALTHDQCEVTDPVSVDEALKTIGVHDMVVNTAAYHRVDECETQPERSFEVNSGGAFYVANAARSKGAGIVHFSTDYVFDGAKHEPYVESDAPNPLNVYGVSKLAGEMVIRDVNPAHYIVRISSVFGVAGSSGKGGNFVETMISKARDGEHLAVVEDMIMSPTFAGDAAHLLLQLLVKRAQPGVYHLANAGQCSWHEFASEILRLCRFDALPEAVAALTRPTPAKRPAYSALASEKLQKLRLTPKSWREGLAEYLKRRSYIPG